MSGERNHVSTDLIGDVSIGGDSICSDNDAINIARLQKMTCHTIGYEGNRHVFLRKFPCSEASALKERPCFIGEDRQPFAGLDRSPYHSKRSPKARGGQRSCIPVSEHTSL